MGDFKDALGADVSIPVTGLSVYELRQEITRLTERLKLEEAQRLMALQSLHVAERLLVDMVAAHDAFAARLRTGSPIAPAERHFKAIKRAKDEVARIKNEESDDG